MTRSRLFVWANAAVLSAACVGLIAGCSRDSESSPVSGTVTYQGKPVPYGQVVFYGGSRPVAVAPIGPDGRFIAPELPDGDLFVAIATTTPVSIGGHRSLDPGGSGPSVPGVPGPVRPGPGGPGPSGPGDTGPGPGGPDRQGPAQPSLPPFPPEVKAMLEKIQAKYGNPMTSGLAYTKGSNPTFDIELK